MKKLLFFIAISLFLPNCHKEKIEYQCAPLPYDQYITGYSDWNWCFSYIYPIYSSPCFNPNNANEILVDYADNEGEPFQLVRYNLKTKKKTVIPESASRTSSVRWSRKGWLIFVGLSAKGRDIYKIKPDGDSLTQLTFSGNCIGPEWDWGGDRFICEIMGSSPKSSLIFDDEGNIQDTIPGETYGPCWQNPKGLLTNAGPNSVWVKDLVLSELWHPFENTTNESYFSSSEWTGEETLLWAFSDGIYRGNVYTGEKNQLKESCNSVIYGSPTYSFISGKAIFVKTTREITGPNTGTAELSLVMMNAHDGSEEVEIVLEE